MFSSFINSPASYNAITTHKICFLCARLLTVSVIPIDDFWNVLQAYFNNGFFSLMQSQISFLCLIRMSLVLITTGIFGFHTIRSEPITRCTQMKDALILHNNPKYGTSHNRKRLGALFVETRTCFCISNSRCWCWFQCAAENLTSLAGDGCWRNIMSSL